MKKVKCSKIMVDCLKNDPVDIKAGGPEMLGYNFFVKQNETQTAVQAIKDTINELKLPLIGINVSNEEHLLDENKVWNTDKIIDCIINESDYIISEAKRQKVYQNILNNQ